jgi:hypothetical protein
MPENKLGLNWSAVEKALAEGTFSGYKIGILETEKLFNQLFKNKQIPGSTIERKIKYVKRYLSLPDKLEYSRNVYGRIINEPHFEISREETKHVVSGYWQAMLDIEEAVQTLSLWEKINLRTRYIFAIILKNFKIVAGIILGLAAVLWFFGETNIGRHTASAIVLANHFFVFKILLWGALIIIALIIIVSILYFALRQKKRF